MEFSSHGSHYGMQQCNKKIKHKTERHTDSDSLLLSSLFLSKTTVVCFVSSSFCFVLLFSPPVSVSSSLFLVVKPNATMAMTSAPASRGPPRQFLSLSLSLVSRPLSSVLSRSPKNTYIYAYRSSAGGPLRHKKTNKTTATSVSFR